MARDPVIVQDAYAFTLRANMSAESYHIAIAEPRGACPPGGFPIVYLLDADNGFATLVEAIRARCRRPDATGVGAAVVVGISHVAAATPAETRARRTRDYTPGPSVTPADDSVPGRGLDAGGADAFLAFLTDDLMPLVEPQLAIDRTRRVLFGHSLAGFFALWAVTAGQRGHVPLFETVVAASPSIWWNPALLHDWLDRADGRRPAALPARMMITAGEFEQRRAPWQPADAWTDDTLRRRAERRMVDAAREAAAAFTRAGVSVDFHEFAGEDHASVVILTMARALRFALPARAATMPAESLAPGENSQAERKRS